MDARTDTAAGHKQREASLPGFPMSGLLAIITGLVLVSACNDAVLDGLPGSGGAGGTLTSPVFGGSGGGGETGAAGTSGAGGTAAASGVGGSAGAKGIGGSGGQGGSAGAGTGGNSGIGGSTGKATFRPLYMESFDGSEVGQSIAEFSKPSTPEKTQYSNDVPGPFGGGSVVKQENDTGKMSFGGRVFSTDLGANSEIWVRWYEYFPANFCFANGTSNADGASGALKWLRFQYPGNSERITMKLDANPSCAPPCNECVTKMTPEGIMGEGTNWKERYGNKQLKFDKKEFSLGEWHALQVYMRLSPGSDDKNDGNGLIRVWVDKQLIAETQRNTMPNSGANLKSVFWGNYWNGGFPRQQAWYLDEVIVTSQKPDGEDVAGNAYIDPARRVSDF